MFSLASIPLAFSAPSATVTEYLALAPNIGSTTTAIEWLKLEYPANVSSAKSVQISSAPKTVAELGSWATLDPKGLALRCVPQLDGPCGQAWPAQPVRVL